MGRNCGFTLNGAQLWFLLGNGDHFFGFSLFEFGIKMVNPVNVLFLFGLERVEFIGKLKLDFAEFFHHGFFFSFGFLDEFFILTSIVFFIFLKFLSENGFNLIEFVTVFVIG